MANSHQRKKALSKEQCKIRVLAIERMLSEGRKITATEIQRRLDLQYDIQVNRRTIYSDIYAIDRFMPIEVVTGRNGGYKKCNLLEEMEDGK